MYMLTYRNVKYTCVKDVLHELLSFVIVKGQLSVCHNFLQGGKKKIHHQFFEN